MLPLMVASARPHRHALHTAIGQGLRLLEGAARVGTHMAELALRGRYGHLRALPWRPAGNGWSARTAQRVRHRPGASADVYSDGRDARHDLRCPPRHGVGTPTTTAHAVARWAPKVMTSIAAIAVHISRCARSMSYPLGRPR